MDVCLLWVFVLSGRGLCDGPISRPEESYRLWCVSECDKLTINNIDTYCEEVEDVNDYETKILNAKIDIMSFPTLLIAGLCLTLTV
jgi:hypothetical protein